MGWLSLLLLTGSVARAELPPPSYRDAVSVRAYETVDALYMAGRCEEAIETAEKFQKTVMATAGLEHLIGLCWRVRNDPRAAEEHLRRSIALDPEHPGPYYDLGEQLLIEGRFDEAAAAFAEVTRLKLAGPDAEKGPLRQAKVAAHLQQPEAFEEHIKEALRRGFSFRDIRGMPNWKKFYADPAMHESVVKMVTVYGTEDVLETLEP